MLLQKRRPVVMGPGFPGCVKSRVSQGSAELFSQLPSPGRGYQWNWFSICMKLRQMFYTQIERRTFHTAWNARTHTAESLYRAVRQSPFVTTKSCGYGSRIAFAALTCPGRRCESCRLHFDTIFEKQTGLRDRGLMVRDGAPAPPHHEGLTACHL